MSLANFQKKSVNGKFSFSYIQVPFLKGYLGAELVVLNHGQMTKATPDLPPLPSPSFRVTPEEGRLAPLRMIWRATGPHAWRSFSGIGFRAWNLQLSQP
ncbi:hypothetical protein AVEN_128096-1 [Araneus ventricosus]|uniref:Uncharacterized protein n=1 Tax=Araneus ventricosus TaxID=182803 RepID=A0A4Y1ZZL0_ARAVE|nr:hypothetical protein AVEN_128096-1 [Araneus ventricosus]